MTGEPVASRRRMVSWTADSYSAFSSGCETRPAWKPWTPTINAAGLGMLPMGSVGSITIATPEVVATSSSSHRRQSEVEGGAVARVRRRPESSPVPIHDGAADRKPHAQPTRLRRIERLEQARRLGLAEADARILDRDDRPEAIVTLLEGRAHDQPAPLRRDLPHGLDGVQQQVQEDLLELDPIAQHRRQVR